MGEGEVNISVVVPTYRRPGPLTWTLATILDQRLDPAIRRARLVVLNNEPDGAAVARAVDKAVARVGRGAWDIQVVHRDPPMYPVYSWYEGIRQFTEPDDLVFLNGDDDVLLHDSLSPRVRMMQSGGWDLLITAALSIIRFTGDPGAEDVRALLPPTVDRRPTTQWREPFALTPERLNDVSAIFISNHAYRNTPRFWDGYQRTLDLMSCIPAGGDDRYAMLPQFLPLPLIEQGKVGASDMTACIRGQSAYEIIEARSGQIAWIRPGYYYASCLYVLDKPLGGRAELQPVRANYRRLCERWHAASRHMADYRATIHDLGLGRSLVTPGGMTRFVQGWLDVAKRRLALNARSLRRRVAHEKSVTFDEFLAC